MDSNHHDKVDGFNDAQIVDISTGFDGFDLPPRSDRFGLIDLFLLLPSVALGLAFISRQTPSHDQTREGGSSLTDNLGMLVDLRIWVPMAMLGLILLLVRKRHRLSRTGSPSERWDGPVSERVKALAIQPDRYIKAIKVLREESGLGLAAAKAVVDSVIKRHRLSRTGSPSARSDGPVSERVKALAIQPDRYIKAIKVLREESGLGLAAAKAVVDSVIKRHRLSRTGSPSARSDGPVSERVKALAIQPDRYIEAIKVLREESGLELAAAKAVVDSIRTRV